MQRLPVGNALERAEDPVHFSELHQGGGAG